jgi:phage terminase large subunit-like protein
MLSELSALDDALAFVEAGVDPISWVPQEHQIPPIGDDWWGWLLMGGRNAGKSAAICAEMNRHAESPACFKSRFPHRMGIIAPTLGDAMESVVYGDAGLVAHNPRITHKAQTGGTFVYWPNGSRAKLFGTNTMEAVDRLRSGGNRSLAVGTLIETEHGPVPIERVRVGDLVWTSHGLRPVTATQDHGIREVRRLTTATGRSLLLTDDHEVWTDRGWVSGDQLRPGDRVSSWNGAVTAGRGSATIGDDLRSTVVPRAGLSTRRSSFIGPYMKMPTGRSPKDITSTTLTRTRTITTRRTSRPTRLSGTMSSTHGRRDGTQPEARHRSREFVIVGSATNAGSHADDLTLGSALAHAGDYSNESTLARCGHVSCAVVLSRLTVGPTARLALDRVVTISPGSIAVPVADLTVAGDHEFIANGLVVANCFDACEEIAAWRYLKAAMEHMELGLRKGTTHWVGATTPKARPTIRRLDADPKVVKSYATSDDNAFADPEWLLRIHERFDNTRQGLQEVKGLILDDVEGALWTMELCATANTMDLPKLRRVVICVDPSWGTTNDECGIIVVGLGADAKCYVLADLSLRAAPAEWGLVAGKAYLREWHGVQPDRILAEKNFQGEQVKLVMATVESELHEHIIFDLVNASQGKRLRAEPVHALYEQGRVLHYIPARLDGLEFQMTNWVPPTSDHESGDKGDPPDPMVDDEGEATSSKFSPDRLDAMVYGVTHFLLEGSTGEARIEVAQGRISRRTEASGAASLPPALRRVVQKQLRHG